MYKILKKAGLIIGPAMQLISASDRFKDLTVRVNQMWQTDLTYLKIIGWRWYYVSTIMDEYSRSILAWELCSTLKAADGSYSLLLA